MNPEEGLAQHAAQIGADALEVSPRRRSFAARLILVASAALAFALLLGLGTWQVVRLQWKLDLIERVDQRVHAAATAAPARARWKNITAAADEYRHVRVSGTFLYDRTTRVRASTVLGSGFWLLTPLRQADGDIVLVNRGFVPEQAAAVAGRKTVGAQIDAHPAESGEPSVTGLLRISEPGGAFLRRNDAVANRWYSRDVQAIALARDLHSVAPYFVDADAGAKTENRLDDPADRPIGGLTVVSFQNNHLVYAMTWYALAAMVAGACWWVMREERRSARQCKNDLDSRSRESEDAKRNKESRKSEKP
ncbi:MAG: SURF1 family protein [Burkholderiaceae bacterium]|nr:SURF1 family protein [Burkholderiaceae bacterium]